MTIVLDRRKDVREIDGFGRQAEARDDAVFDAAHAFYFGLKETTKNMLEAAIAVCGVTNQDPAYKKQILNGRLESFDRAYARIEAQKIWPSIQLHHWEVANGLREVEIRLDGQSEADCEPTYHSLAYSQAVPLPKRGRSFRDAEEIRITVCERHDPEARAKIIIDTYRECLGTIYQRKRINAVPYIPANLSEVLLPALKS